MKLPSLPPRRVVVWWVASALPLAAIVAVGAYLSYHYHELLKESRDRVDNTYETLDAPGRLLSSVEDAEQGSAASSLPVTRRTSLRSTPRLRRRRRSISLCANLGKGASRRPIRCIV